MTPEHRRQVEEPYRAALDGEPAEREAILADPELRREIESLLHSAVLKLTPGAQLGPYRMVVRYSCVAGVFFGWSVGLLLLTRFQGRRCAS